MSHLSRIKNPDLLYPSVAAALRAYNYVLSSLDVQTPWEPLLPSLAYLSWGLLRPSRPCQLIAMSCYCFPYLGHPLYAISCLTIAIYAMPFPPLGPIEGVRGIYPF